MSTQLVLGRIKEISFYDLQVSLVEGRTGTVKVYNVSNRYKGMLEAVVRGEQPKDMPVLTDMFSVGQYLPCVIMSSSDKKLELSANPRDVNKGIPMHQINSRMLLYGAIDSIEDHGYTIDLGVPGLVGFLPKCETTEFISRCNSGRPLCIGALVPVRLLDDIPDAATNSTGGSLSISAASTSMSLSLGETRIAKLTCNPARLMSNDRAWPETVPCSFDCLIPGNWLQAKVHRTVDATGQRKTAYLVAHFQRGSIVCTVPKSHLPGKLAGYRQGDPILLTIVSVDQSTKTLVASCLPHTLPPRSPDAVSSDDKDSSSAAAVEQPKKKKRKKQKTEDLPPYDASYYSIGRIVVGQIVENAEVRKLTKSGGATLWLPDAQIACLIGPKQMPAIDDANSSGDEEDSSTQKKKKKKTDKKKKNSNEKEESSLSVGDKVRVRILDISPMDNVAYGSLKQSVLGLPFLRYEDVKLASPVSGTLIRYCKEGAVVKIARNIRGLIPYLHMSDYPTGSNTTQLEPGTQLNCRVLTVSPADRKLILTAKPSLVRSREAPITKVEQLVPGVLADSFIAKLDSNGILLVFYGGAKAWAPRTQLGLADSDSIEQVYYRGQVLRVRIIRPASGDRLPVASLLMDGRKTAAETQAVKTKRRLTEQLRLKVGSLCSCRIISKQNGNFKVALAALDSPDANLKDSVANQLEALLPFEHLTDQANYVNALVEIRRNGDVISPCVIWSVDASIVVSSKPSLVRLAKESDRASVGLNFPVDFDSIEVGDLLLGAIDQFKQYGCFVQLPSGYRGLAPIRALASEHPPFPLKDLFSTGQTVVAKVLEKNAEKRRCLLSLRVRDCVRPSKDLDDSLLLLEDTLRLLDSGGLCPNDLLPGRLVRVVATADGGDSGARSFRLLDGKTKAQKYTCKADANHLLGADCAAGSRHTALVLSVNPVEKIVSVCLRPDLLSQLAAAQSTARVADVSPGEAYSAEVLYAGADYRMLALRLGPTTQQVAFLPARRHWNESYSACSPTVGSQIKVVVQRIIRGGGSCETGGQSAATTAAADTGVGLYRLTALQSEYSKAEGFRHLAPSSVGNGTVAKTGPALSKRNVVIGEAFVVRVVAITNCQLNVEDLHSRTKGRIFITELTDSPQQMINPLTAFSVGQELLARVVGIRPDRIHEDPSHPLGGKRSSLYELSARPSVLARPGNDFKDLFDLPLSNQSEMWLYVQHADAKLRTVSMYAAINKTLSVPYLDVSNDLDQLAKLSKFLPYGAAMKAWPISFANTIDNAPSNAEDFTVDSIKGLRVTCLGPDACLPLKAGDCVATYVTSASQFFYRAKLSANRSGQLHALDMHPSRPADIADLCKAAARYHRLPIGTSNRRRAPFMLAEVIRVDGRLHWLRPVLTDASESNSLATNEGANSNVILVGYVARQCDRGLAVTFGGAKRTGVVKVPGRARRLFPIGRRIHCSPLVTESENTSSDSRTRLYRLEEPIPTAGKKRPHGENNDEAIAEAGASYKIKRRRLKLTKSAANDIVTQTDLVNGVLVVTHNDPIIQKPNKLVVSNIYSPLKLDEADENLNEGDIVDSVDHGDHGEKATSKRNRRQGETTRQEFESLVSREPGNPSHWTDYARYHSDAEEFDAARSVIERGLVAVGKLGAGDTSDAGRRQLYRSLLLLEAKAVGNATADTDPDSLDRLIQATHRACQLQDPALCRLAATTLLDCGEGDKAETVAVKLRRARPDCPKAWRLQLEVKLRRGRNDDAKRLLFDQALSSLPKRHHLGLLSGFAELAFRHGRRSDGVATFESLLKSHPNRPELYLLYGRCLLSNEGGMGGGGLSAAKDLLDRAKTVLPVDNKQLLALDELIGKATASADDRKARTDAAAAAVAATSESTFAKSSALMIDDNDFNLME